MAVNTAQGSKFYIAPQGAQPADAAAYAALVWTEVKEVESYGDIGDESSVVNFTSVGDTRTRKFKGPRDAGTFAVVAGKDSFDAGQIAMKAAESTKFSYPFKMELADKLDANDTNTIYYFYGPVLSQRDSIGAVDNVVRTNFSIGVNIKPVEVPATVVP